MTDIKTIGRNLRQITDPSTRRFLERIVENIDILGEGLVDLEDPDPLQWSDVVLLNNWVRFSSQFAPPQYTQTIDGFVLLRGVISTGTATAGTILFTLPAGFRPEYHVMLSTVSDTGSSRVDVETTGNVVIQSGGNTSFSLDNIQFQAFR